MVKVVVLISGKRKSGKDYLSRMLRSKLSPLEVSIFGVSHSLKALYANENGLDYSELISDSPYKENHRAEMIEWGERVRDADPHFFCKTTIPPNCTADVVIISDCRRPSDILYFTSNYSALTVRVVANNEERIRRGFRFVEGIDDMPSECALDDYKHDIIIRNDNSCDLQEQLEVLVQAIGRFLPVIV